ncbi:MAG TPA: L-rhamnose isomerase [Clostridiales bacterium]|jgi:L-rhamnose isomerase|nr:L-rhamnose isomerase [Clostridiales bacterium]
MYHLYKKDTVEQDYNSAKELYGELGVDTDAVLKQLSEFQVSMHCWQGDDVAGLEEKKEGVSGGGIMATGNYPGRARNGEELRADMEKAMSLIPGKQRVNLHASYAETDGAFVERDELRPEHFRKWIDWAKKNNTGIDFNSTFFAHPMADSGFTLSSTDKNVREFWIRHAKACREIAAAIGSELGSPVVHNIWIPDGSKDLPADRMLHRQILRDSLDEILSVKYDRNHIIDAVESKLFGIGSEAYVVGSHEFYMGYAMTRDVMVCLDAGHFHPTEGIADKISSILTFSEELLLHVSRGVRWDSDHVILLNDDLLSIAQEIKRCNALDRVHFGLDFFDASINRLTAWVTGTRNAMKSVLIALLEPTHLLREAEERGSLGDRLALMEELKTLPFGSVWNKFCLDQDVPVGAEWLNDIKEYEEKVLLNRE